MSVTRIRYKNNGLNLTASIDNYQIYINLEKFSWDIYKNGSEPMKLGQANSINEAKKVVKKALENLGVQFVPETRLSKKHQKKLREAQEAAEQKAAGL